MNEKSILDVIERLKVGKVTLVFDGDGIEQTIQIKLVSEKFEEDQDVALKIEDQDGEIWEYSNIGNFRYITRSEIIKLAHNQLKLVLESFNFHMRSQFSYLNLEIIGDVRI